MWLSNPSVGPVRSDSKQKTLYFQCRGRGSNPHGAFAPEDFKSLKFDANHLILLAIFLHIGENV